MTKAERMPLLAHLEEFRSRVIKASVAVLIGSVVAYIFRDAIFELLAGPWNELAGNDELVFFRPAEAFSIFMRLSLFGGVVLASPVIVWQLWAFVHPALTDRERRYVAPVGLMLGLLFLVGVLVGYWALSRGLDFLIGFGGDQIAPVIGASAYLSFAVRFILVFGVAFEFPVFMFAAAATGVVSSRQLAKSRRWAILSIVVIGAVVTPSGDPLTLLLLSVPLYILYEFTLIAIRLVLKK